MNRRNQKKNRNQKTAAGRQNRHRRPSPAGRARAKQRRRTRRRIILVFFLLLLLAAGGFLFYRYLHPVDLKSEVVTHELMEPFDPWDNVKHLYFVDKDDVTVQSDTDRLSSLYILLQQTSYRRSHLKCS